MLNKKIPNYKKQTSIFGGENYTVPIKLGANETYNNSIHNVEINKLSLRFANGSQIKASSTSAFK